MACYCCGSTPQSMGFGQNCPCCNCKPNGGYNYLPRNIPLALGQPSNGGCCCRFRPPEDIPLPPPCCCSPPPVYYCPRPIRRQRCEMPPSCYCHPCTAPHPCCRPGACNPRRIPPGVCAAPCCCQPCRVPKRCMPPPCRRCNRPCCQKPPLLPIPAWQPRCYIPGAPTIQCDCREMREGGECGNNSVNSQDGNGCYPDPVSVKYKTLNVEVRVTDDSDKNQKLQQEVEGEAASCLGCPPPTNSQQQQQQQQ